VLVTDYLKKETNAFHKMAEESSGALMFFKENYKIQDVQRFFVTSFLFNSAIEKALEPFLENSFFKNVQYHLRIKKEKLIEDLNVLKLPAPDINMSINFDNKEQAIGALYVKEGSALGGKYILSALKKNAPEDFIVPPFFLNCYEENLGAMWKSFCDEINKEVNGEFAREQVLTGAKKAFEYFIDLTKK
jgi:heme oxygenase (biliverdin-IX-beta and delta-forming)